MNADVQRLARHLCLHRVAQNIQQHLGQLHRISHHHGRQHVGAHLNVCRILALMGGQQLQNILHHDQQVHRFEIGF